MSQYPQLVNKYIARLSKAPPTVIANADKAKLLKVLTEIAADLKMEDQNDKLIDIHNGLITDLENLSKKFKKWDEGIRDRNKKLEAAIKRTEIAAGLAKSEKNLMNSPDFSKLPDDMTNVSDSFYFMRRKEFELETKIQQNS